MVETAMRSMPIVSMEPPRPANSPTWRCAHARRRRQSARVPQPERAVGIGDDAAQEMHQHHTDRGRGERVPVECQGLGVCGRLPECKPFLSLLVLHVGALEFAVPVLRDNGAARRSPVLAPVERGPAFRLARAGGRRAERSEGIWTRPKPFAPVSGNPISSESPVHAVRCCRVSGLIDCGISRAEGPYGDTRVESNIGRLCSKALAQSLVFPTPSR